VRAGLGGALALLKERGELNQSKAIVWSGRNNDMKPGKLEVVGDVFTGGKAEDEQANRIENALRRTDEFGRQKTPKEAWRELNHGYDGLRPLCSWLLHSDDCCKLESPTIHGRNGHL